MNVTATLLGQMATFLVLIAFISKFLWGPLTQVLEDRKKRIADGLEAAERAHQERELAKKRAVEIIKEARDAAAVLIDQAQSRARVVVEEAQEEARGEAERLLVAAKTEIGKEVHRAKEDLRNRVATLAIAGAAQILRAEIDVERHKQLLDRIAATI